MAAFRKTGADSIAAPHRFGWLKLESHRTLDLWERPDGKMVALNKNCLLFRDARDHSIKRVREEAA